MNTQYTNATDINYVWFALSDIGISYSVHNERSIRRKSSHFGDFDHLRYQRDEAIADYFDVRQSRGDLIREVTYCIDDLTKSLNALRKNKLHVTDDHVERVIDNLTAAVKKITDR